MTSLAAAPSRARARVASEQPVVAAQGLTKVFRDFWLRPRARAVDHVDLTVHRGEIFGLLGPNGSGKSTTIKLILGLLRKTSGRLAVFGRLPTDVSIKKRIGYLPEESYFYPFLNARETLDYYARLFELDHRARERRIDELLDMVGLTAVQHRQIHEYSKGMQRRIGLAQALINDPEFLILDEPTSGLDPLGSRQVKDLILELGRRGKTILLSSHLLADVEDCVDRLVILYGGKVRAEGTPESLLTAKNRTIIETDALDEGTLTAIDELIRARTGRALQRVDKPRQRLEDLFLDIVEQARAERLETSGAGAGGPTAAFLRADADTEGEEVIDRLLRPEQPPEPAPTPAAKPAEPARPDENVIERLVEQPRPERPAGPREQPKRAPDVDRSIIDALTSDKPADDKPKSNEP